MTGKIPPIHLPEAPAAGDAKPIGERQIFHEGTYHDVPIYSRRDLGQGTVLTGPVVVEQEDTTIWVLPGWTAAVDPLGNMIVKKNQ